MTKSALQRKNMVESQVRPSDVTDRRIIAAMQEIERERFLPASAAELAYMDEDLKIDAIRRLMAPRVFARLLQLAEIGSGDKILIVGALHGYSAAVVSRLAMHVVALEVDPDLVFAARSALTIEAYNNVSLVCGPLELGWADGAPYNSILVEGAVERIPDQLSDQLSDSGRLVAVEVSDRVGHAIVLQKAGQSSLSRRVAFDVSAPRLPGFSQPKTFVF